MAGASQSNFVGAAVQGLSICTTPIEILKNDGSDEILAHATGFFWSWKGRPCLVTNYHVISGRNALTGALDPKTAFIPSKLRFYGLSVTVSGNSVQFHRQLFLIEVNKAISDMLSEPPVVNGNIVDIWGLPLPIGIVFGKDPSRRNVSGLQAASCFVNDHQTKRIVTNAGDDCVILGYPLQNYEALMPPIWKRGSIATDTNIGVGGRPVFLVDSATTPGMSGSPIFRKVVTYTADNKDIGALQEFSIYDFIGVYAGRLQRSDLYCTGLGYGWYSDLVEGVLEHYNYGKWLPVVTPTE